MKSAGEGHDEHFLLRSPLARRMSDGDHVEPNLIVGRLNAVERPSPMTRRSLAPLLLIHTSFMTMMPTTTATMQIPSFTSSLPSLPPSILPRFPASPEYISFSSPSTCVGKHLDVSADGLIATAVLSSAVGLVSWVRSNNHTIRSALTTLSVVVCRSSSTVSIYICAARVVCASSVNITLFFLSQ